MKRCVVINDYCEGVVADEAYYQIKWDGAVPAREVRSEINLDQSTSGLKIASQAHTYLQLLLARRTSV